MSAKEADKRTFTLDVPDITTTVEQGGRDEVTVSINRGEEFKEDVKLQFKAPAGLTVLPADAAIKAGTEETKLTLEATADAPPGDTHIDVTAVPQTGTPITKSMPVTVTR